MASSDWSRRRFIKTAGVSVALPLLPSLVWSKRAGAQSSCAPVQRLITYMVPNGHHLVEHVPTTVGSGTAWTLPNMLVPMQANKPDLLFVSGLENQQRRRTLGDHSIGSGSLFTARFPTMQQQITSSSVDQIVADKIGNCTSLPSMQLGTHNIAGADQYGTFYTRNISWRGLSTNNADGTMSFPQGPATPLGKTIDPLLAFNSMFQGTNTGASTASAATRLALKQSVLDAVVPHGTALRAQLNAADQVKLDELLTGIRSLETQLQNQAAHPVSCTPPATPGATLGTDNTQFPTFLNYMHTLMTIALQCDITRVISFMMGDAQNQRDLSFIPSIAALGAEMTDHTISHNMNAGERLVKYRLAVLWKMTQIGAFLTMLKTTTDVNGEPLLANTLVLISSDLSDGNAHNHDDYPMLVAGQLGGLVSTDRHIRYTPDPNNIYTNDKTFGDFYITLLGLYGVNVTTFGNDGVDAITWNRAT
ncbi:MAG: DUF1552 domain-containing protein [Polyangiaceae bacterium]